MDPFSVTRLGALLEVLWGTKAFIQDETGSGLCVARSWERAHGKALNIYPWQPHTRGHQALRTFRSKHKTGIQGGYEDVWQRLVMNRVELRREGRTHINDSNKHRSQTYTRGRQKPRRFRSSHKKQEYKQGDSWNKLNSRHSTSRRDEGRTERFSVSLLGVLCNSHFGVLKHLHFANTKS